MKTRQEKEDTTEYNTNSTVWLVCPKIVAKNTGSPSYKDDLDCRRFYKKYI
jgi:hypothetical protein